MARKVHYWIGFMALLFYLKVHFNLKTYASKLNESLESGYMVGDGVAYLYLIALFSLACFFMPTTMMYLFSPVTEKYRSYVFKEGAWYVFGYFSFFTVLLWGQAFR